MSLSSKLSSLFNLHSSVVLFEVRESKAFLFKQKDLHSSVVLFEVSIESDFVAIYTDLHSSVVLFEAI